MNTAAKPMLPVDESAAPLTRGFLLIEPTMLFHTPDLAALDMRPCAPRVLAHREELMPHLIDLAALDAQGQDIAIARWQEEVTAERPPVACAWLNTEADSDTVVEHIARHLVGPGVHGRTVFWRYYDPRVFSLTLAVLEPGQQRALLGPIGAWQFAWAGHRWSVDAPGTKAEPEDQSTGWPRPDQWPRLDRSEVAEQVRQRLPALTLDQAARLPTAIDRALHAMIDQDATSAEALVDHAVQRVQQDLLAD
ncbi:DUF4123 domain-containing protein [Burkholderia gladioli]|uniref:DUF4123 domain-containing protein n=1 Tax=Burkholderia gladioli TaxID=28095 RepID=UPI000649E989|nr:DUF4123 domain-containing protein [Burkholderia gladioli]MDA0574026.1 DUF4123 domain-containing protein [Burkholderia gladioli]MDA0603884.1 DUF4123 domain-containing protein [Burkholderia gladioli]